MAVYTFNVAKGRVVELYERVKANDPAPSALILVPLAVTDTEANCQDFATLAAVLAATPDEAGGSWGRKTLTDAELAAFPAADNTNNRYSVALPSVTWTAPTAGQNTVGLLVCYDADTGAGTDANIIPLTHHDMVVTADGNDVVLNAALGDFFRAS